MPFNKLTTKDKKDIKTAKKLGCNWIALSYIQNAKLVTQTRKLINKDMGIICKFESVLQIHLLKGIRSLF